jgi:hypothetical protein
MLSTAFTLGIFFLDPLFVQLISFRRRRWILMKHTLFHELLRSWPMCNFLIQTVRTHMLLEFPLLCDDSRSGIGIGKDIACDEELERSTGETSGHTYAQLDLRALVCVQALSSDCR